MLLVTENEHFNEVMSEKVEMNFTLRRKTKEIIDGKKRLKSSTEKFQSMFIMDFNF